MDLKSLQEEESFPRKESENLRTCHVLDAKGDMHKNRAELYRISNRSSEASSELNRSEETFRAVLKVEPKDPSALSGLGSVAILRGDLVLGEQYLDKAIAVAPKYEPAKHDLQTIRKLRESGHGQ